MGYFHASKVLKLAFLSFLTRKYVLWKGFYHDFSPKEASASGALPPGPPRFLTPQRFTLAPPLKVGSKECSEQGGAMAVLNLKTLVQSGISSHSGLRPGRALPPKGGRPTMCSPEGPLSASPVVRQQSHFKQKSLKVSSQVPPFEKNLEILASTASMFKMTPF